MKTKDALLKSIDKWDKICFEGGEDRGIENCALCKLYFNEWDRDSCCLECPIHWVTNKKTCWGTPYISFADYTHKETCEGKVFDDLSFELALQEYFFLCMLYHEYYGD